MKHLTRAVAASVLAVAVSVGVVSLSAPAQAMDSSWGWVKTPTSAG